MYTYTPWKGGSDYKQKMRGALQGSWAGNWYIDSRNFSVYDLEFLFIDQIL
jgi:hypothetical protein